MAALNSMTVDSTGDTKDHRGRWHNGGPRTYTLTVGEENIDLSKKNLGPADVALVVVWLQRPEVSATLTKIDIRGANIDEEVLATLKGVAPEGCEVRWK